MDLTLNRTLAGKSLPPGGRVIAAVNEGDEYQLTDLDPTLVSRFNVYAFAPTVEDWLVCANDTQLDERVVAFLQEHSDCLDSDPKAAPITRRRLVPISPGHAIVVLGTCCQSRRRHFECHESAHQSDRRNRWSECGHIAVEKPAKHGDDFCR